MTIGIDIDDTITNSNELMVEYAIKYFNIKDIEKINNILNGKIEGKTLDFYNEYAPELMKNYTLKDNVKEVIDRLRSNGHKIVIITARGHSVHNGLEEITEEYFKKHQIIVDKMIFKTTEKGEACIQNNVDIMIDDSIKVLEKIKEKNIKALLFVSVNNKDYNTNLDRVNNWIELEEYINKLSIKN